MSDKVMPEDIDCVSSMITLETTLLRLKCIAIHRDNFFVAQVIAELPEELREQFGEDFVESTNDMFGEKSQTHSVTPLSKQSVGRMSVRLESCGDTSPLTPCVLWCRRIRSRRWRQSRY